VSRLVRFAAAVPLCIALAACGAPTPPTAGDPTDFNAVCDSGNAGKRLALVGYLRLPSSFPADADDVVLDLYRGTEPNSIPVGVRTKFGTDANHVEPVTAKQYSDSDLKVHLADGKAVDYQTKVKVSGSMYVPNLAAGGTCALDNPLIEAAP
jgi:hypothetical protein